MPDAPFEQFFHQTAALRWASVEEIATRGRQRRARRRFGAAAGAAAVAVGLVLAGSVVRGDPRPEPAPPATPPVSASASPSSPPPMSAAPSTPTPSSSTGRAPLTAVPPAAMLREADAGPGDWTVSEEAHGDWKVEFSLGLCDAGRNLPYVDGVDDRTRTLSLIPGEPGPAVLQQVTLFATGRAPAHVAALRAKVRACAAFTAEFAGNQPFEMRIVADGFATADESFVIDVRTGGEVFLYAIVRVGALVTQVTAEPDTEAETMRLGRVAADRLSAVG